MLQSEQILIATTAAKAIAEGRRADGERLLVAVGDDGKTAKIPLRLGTQLLAANMPEPASVLLTLACERAPRFAYAWRTLGHAFRWRKAPVRAAECYRRALQLNGEEPEALFHLGECLVEIEDFDGGRQALERADQLQPSGMAHMALANLARHLYRFEDAIRHFRRATELLPADTFELRYSHTMLGITALLVGDYATGWGEYEWRLSQARRETHEWWNTILPHWDGTLRPGLRLAVHAEQGLGDTLQFVRYCRWLREQGVVVILVVQRPLAALLARQQPALADAVVIEGDRMPDAEAHVSLLSLPAKLLPVWGDMLFMTTPYLKADPARVERARQVIAAQAGGRPAIGLAWAGNPNYPQDRERSMSYEQLGPLLAADVAFFSLQLGAERDKLRADPAPRMVDLGAHLTDFEASAAFVTALDGVVSVDSAPAHLAAALGRPVALPLPRRNDFRWGLAPATRSPWYADIRLYRQGADASWPPVLAELAQRLEAGIAFDPPCA